MTGSRPWATVAAAGLALAGLMAVTSGRLPESSSESGGLAAALAGPDRVVVFFFHGRLRCSACDRMEAYAKEAVMEHFAHRLRQGSLEWRSVNYDLPENAHFKKELQLVASSVVAVSLRSGRVEEVRDLCQLSLLLNDKQAFQQRLVAELNDFLCHVESDR